MKYYKMVAIKFIKWGGTWADSAEEAAQWLINKALEDNQPLPDKVEVSYYPDPDHPRAVTDTFDVIPKVIKKQEKK